MPAVGAEPDAHDGGAMPFVAQELPAGGRIPDPHAPIRADEAAPRDDPHAVGAEVQAEDPAVVPAEGQRLASGAGPRA